MTGRRWKEKRGRKKEKRKSNIESKKKERSLKNDIKKKEATFSFTTSQFISVNHFLWFLIYHDKRRHIPKDSSLHNVTFRKGKYGGRSVSNAAQVTWQDKQCTYNVTMGWVWVTIVAIVKQYYIFRVCVCVWEGVGLSYPACQGHSPFYIVICGLSGSTKFFQSIS
jgi:hypothetical protein